MDENDNVPYFLLVVVIFVWQSYCVLLKSWMWSWGVAQLVECLPNMHKVLASVLSTA